MRVKIISDSTCDLSPELLERYDIAITPLCIIKDGEEFQDGVNITPADIFAHVDGGGSLCSTAAVSQYEYGKVFARYAKEYDAVVQVTIGANFSCCYQNACLAAQEFDNVYVVDSENLSSGQGLLVVAAAKLAARWYGEPAGRMTVVGVTGTNGKTTTTYLLKQLLERCLGAKVGLIGTNQNMIGDAVLPAERTTPDALTLQRLLREMADAGCTHVVMEVSSHALVQRRAGAIDFALGVFTNLTQDHLDYHGTMEAYCDAKARLFRQCRAAAVNGDDPWTPRLLENVTCPVTRFGQGLANDLVGWDAHYCADRVSFTACSDSEHIPVTLHIPGAFSLYNALAALAAAQALGIPIEDAAQALSLCQGVRGRAEVVPTDTDYTVLIDYAHTPDGLKNILSTVCGFADARVLVVFGCGGDRDRTKRAEMGRIAARLADEVIVTSDNPRTENPYAILHEILAGMADSATPFAVLESRREAITYALDHARTGDVVVLAGKGHETYQVVGAETLPLDERQVVREHLSQ